MCSGIFRAALLLRLIGRSRYNLRSDLGETTDLSRTHPEIFTEIAHNMSVWKWSVINSALKESECEVPFPPGPEPPHPAMPPNPPRALLPAGPN